MDSKAVLNGILVAVIVVAVGVLVFRLLTGDDGLPPPPPREPIPVWFYDVGTGELFVGTSEQVPPIDAPSGAGNGVGVYAIEHSDDPEKTPKAVYLYKFLDEAYEAQKAYKQAMVEGKLTPDMAAVARKAQDGKLIADPQNIEWIQITQPGAEQIIDRRMQQVGDRRHFIEAFPPR